MASQEASSKGAGVTGTGSSFCPIGAEDLPATPTRRYYPCRSLAAYHMGLSVAERRRNLKLGPVWIM